MHTLKQRVVVALAATFVAAAVGTAAGYLLGRAVTLRLAESQLAQLAARTIAEADASSRESRSVLATIVASKRALCSEEELASLRLLIFRSEYLQDAGHIRNGKIVCSATLGRLDQPIPIPPPDFSQSDRTSVYKSFPPLAVGRLNVVALQLNDSYVIFSPFLEVHRAAPPIHYFSLGIEDPNQKAGRELGAFSQAGKAILATDGQGRFGEMLYATRCSSKYFNCITDSISVSDAMRTGSHLLFGTYMALGGLSGILVGFYVSLLYRRNRNMVHQLRRAIAGDNLGVVYQPIVQLGDGRIVGAEALARWTDEEGFSVDPEVFIRVAEDQGFVVEITRLVLRHALRDFATTLRKHPEFRLSVNTSADDLRDPGFVPMIERAVKHAGVEAQSLAIEITESSTAQQEVAIETIRRLRGQGYSVHIDDFGTGYSGLAYLHALSVDAIKIDKSFTHAIGTEAVTVAILPQILAMARALKLRVIVEGIETAQQAAHFTDAQGEIFAQGYFFGRPVPADQFHRMLAENDAESSVASAGL